MNLAAEPLTFGTSNRRTAMPGLVWAYRFDANGRGEAISPERDALDRPAEIGAKDNFLWLHLDLVDHRACDWCTVQSVLPAAAKQVFLSPDNHLRLDHGEGILWGVFADLARELGDATDAHAPLRFVMSERWLITGRRHPLSGALAAREKIDAGSRCLHPCNVLETMAECVLERIAALTESLEKDLDSFEDRILARGMGIEDIRLAPIRHKFVRHNRLLSKFCATLHRFVDRKSEADLPPEMHAVSTRLVNRVEALRHDVEALHERARLLQEEASDRRAAEMNRHLYILSILTAVLMPPTLVVGIFGMNTTGIPFEGSSDGFLVALALALASSGIIYWFLQQVRRRGDRR